MLAPHTTTTRRTRVRGVFVCIAAASAGVLTIAGSLGTSGGVRVDAPYAGIASTAGKGDLDDGDGSPLFNRDVRPILSNHCYQCHGPDSASREAGLRLDKRDEALAELESGVRAIVPGDADASEILRRITHPDPDSLMPPVEVGKPLSPEQIETLRRWIESGAEYQQHWSFVPPVRPELPDVLESSQAATTTATTPGTGSWSDHPIDRFVLATLRDQGLDHSPRASAETLLRRASFDLTGLPPSPAEIDQLLADDSPEAFARAVDRLLASPRFGEHMARHWLDAARYGDTHGLHLDNAREMWPWRDWVIHAFNSNMPFDRFTIEQLAGDLLPEPTGDQLVATGFNRNHVSTNEGGVIVDEVQMNNVADRISTTGTVWLGLTLNCAHCHDHKFDPIRHDEYYELFAFFNNTTENPMDGNRADWAPFVRVPSDEQAAALDAMDERIAQIKAELDDPSAEIDAAQEAWQSQAAADWAEGWIVPEVSSVSSAGGSMLRTLDDRSVLAEGENPDHDTYQIITRTNATDLSLLRVEALTHESLPHKGAGRAENANFVLSEIELEARPAGDDNAEWTPIRLVAAAADHQQMNGPYPVAAAIDSIIDETNGWAVDGMTRREDRLAVFAAAEPFGFAGGTELRTTLRFETHFPGHAIGRVRLAVSGDAAIRESVLPVGLGTWHAVGPFPAADRDAAFAIPFGPELEIDSGKIIDTTATYESNLAWTIHPEWTDGQAHTLEGEISATYLTRSIHAGTPRTLTLSLGSDDAIKVWCNGVLVHENNVARAVAPDQDRVEIDLHAGENFLLLKIANFGGGYGFYFNPDQTSGSDALRMLPLITAESLTGEQALTLRRYYRSTRSPVMRELAAELDTITADRDAQEATLPLTLVMEEREEVRPTHRLERGDYASPREEVYPDVPDALPPLAADAPRNRLGFARWLVSPEHPLTARVTVNRLWQQMFGTGLVKTAEDFGSQGDWPSHPDLLDWLAVEFVESGWDVKHMLRLVATSQTYQQRAEVTPETLAHDPENRLLARGPRFRLEAEEIRDQALLASGLLNETLGGPSVKPEQPDGLWADVGYTDSDTANYTPDEGQARFRRSMYTYWKRTSPPPNMTAFDAPTREACTVRRSRTNTPMQALVLLNDPQFVEAARVLARRVLRAEPQPEGQLTMAFRLLTSRTPDAAELGVLRELYRVEFEHYQQQTFDALARLSVGAEPRDESLDPAAHAAMTSVASVILTLDEAVNK